VARLAIQNLTRYFTGPSGQKIRGVEDLTFEINEGELFVLVGPSGCGKTTTLRLIAGLEEPDAGTITMDGRLVHNLPPQNREMAMVFQHHALYPHMNAGQNIAFGLKIRKFPRSEIDNRVDETAATLGITDCLARMPQQLSGGQSQRVALARAMVRQPKVFLFDEPLSNIDPSLRMQLRTEILRLHKNSGVAMIYVTHDQFEAMTMGDRVAVIRDGVLQQVDRPLAIYNTPANRFVAGFIGSPPMNFINGHLYQQPGGVFFKEANTDKTSLKSLCVRLADSQAAALQNEYGREVVLGIRPENILEAGDHDSISDSVFESVIELVQIPGPEVHLNLALPNHQLIARVRATKRFSPGQKCFFQIEMEHAHFFDPQSGRALLSPSPRR
jgi:multiple sugar transport system ATP-binding protein